MRALQRTLAVALPVAAAVAFTVTPAQAGGVGIYCNDWDANCGTFYYNSGSDGGSRITFTGRSGWDGEIADLAGYKFLDNGAGKGQNVKNNAGGFYNGSMQKATVFFRSGFVGACDTVPSVSRAYKLVNTYNDNASLGFGSRTGVNCYNF
ncbi:peptidase inhibitor family I36 protein [Streptomyces sp. NPDC002104]